MLVINCVYRSTDKYIYKVLVYCTVYWMYWSEALSFLPDHEVRFTHNDASETLPTLTLLFGSKARCKLCGFPTQTLQHVPNKRRRLCDSVGLIEDTTLSYLQLHCQPHPKVTCPCRPTWVNLYCFPVHCHCYLKWSTVLIVIR